MERQEIKGTYVPCDYEEATHIAVNGVYTAVTRFSDGRVQYAGSEYASAENLLNLGAEFVKLEPEGAITFEASVSRLVHDMNCTRVELIVPGGLNLPPKMMNLKLLRCEVLK